MGSEDMKTACWSWAKTDVFDFRVRNFFFLMLLLCENSFELYSLSLAQLFFKKPSLSCWEFEIAGKK